VLFERLAIDVLKECDVLGAARMLHLSWDEAWHLMDRGCRPKFGREAAGGTSAGGGG
jgi:transposase